MYAHVYFITSFAELPMLKLIMTLTALSLILDIVFSSFYFPFLV